MHFINVHVHTHYVLSKKIGDKPKQTKKVSGVGQMKLGSLLATDAFFTFLTTNMWATLSDKYGRKVCLCILHLYIYVCIYVYIYYTYDAER